MDYSTPALRTRDKKTGTPPPKPERRPTAPEMPESVATAPRVRTTADRVIAAAVVLLLAMCAVAAFAPLLTPYAGDAVDFSRASHGPSLAHPFGTDDLGRDLLYRVLIGGRVTLIAGLVAALFAVLIGTLVGAIAGYRGGWTDALLMRFTDISLSIPAFFVVLFITGVLSPGIIMICMIIGMTQWMEVARVSRSVVASAKHSAFVDAARALGVPGRRVLVRHILTHASGPVLISATLAVAQAIMTESALSFLGFGVQPPHASWGLLLRDAQSHLGTAPWLALFPGAMIFITVLTFYTLGDAVRNRLSPHRKRLRA